MRSLIITAIFILLLISTAFAADITPTCRNARIAGGQQAQTYFCEWNLETNRSASGDSDVAIDVSYCVGYKKLEITTSGGAVNISFAIKEDDRSKTTSTFTSVTAETVFKNSVDPIKRLFVTSTITSGQVDNITFSCNQQ